MADRIEQAVSQRTVADLARCAQISVGEVIRRVASSLPAIAAVVPQARATRKTATKPARRGRTRIGDRTWTRGARTRISDERICDWLRGRARPATIKEMRARFHVATSELESVVGRLVKQHRLIKYAADKDGAIGYGAI